VTRAWTVAKREYLERVRSKAFLIGTLVGPILLVGLSVGPSLLMAKQRGKPLRVALVCDRVDLRDAVEKALAGKTVANAPRFLIQPAEAGPADAARLRMKDAILKGTLDGYLYLPPDVLERSAAEYYGKNVSNVMDIGLLDRSVEEALTTFRLEAEGLTAERIKALTRKLDLKTVRVSESGDRVDRGASFILSMVLMMILYTALAMWGAALMNGVIEEKTSRVVEVIASSIPATQFFMGKVAGVGAAGLTQFLVWALCLGGIGAYAAKATALAGVSLPEIPAVMIVFFVVFFVLGYFLYGVMYAAVGAAVNSQQEAQGFVMVVILPLVAGFMFFPMVLQSPDSTLSVVLSLIPFWTPLLMFLRIAALTPPAWQLALSVAIMVVTILIFNWVASRIYRVGILMYGKRPTLPEIIRWVRHS
jgi:ABC-2 type transport system permease protein